MSDAVMDQKTEAERIALDNDVKAAEKRLADARAAALASAKPKITGFTGFVGVGLREGLFNIFGENLGGTNPMGVQLNGHTAKVTSVKAHLIKGQMPFDVKAGTVTVKIGDVTFVGKVSA